ncbi:MAG: DUF3108 domain-containing protein [Gemmatimonadetes bacterium]|nr:DUF3108 domain-containing protein [Gemmatimonadota bacterium]
MSAVVLRGRWAVLGGLALSALVLPPSLLSQDNEDARDPVATLDSLAALYPTNELAAAVPFGPGEQMRYRVEIGWFDVGEGHMTVEALDSVRGNSTYRATMEIDAGILGLRVHDIYTTFFDVSTLQSWRFLREMNQVTYHATRHYEFYPEEGIWENEDKEEGHKDRFGPLGSSLPLDDISLIYFLRQMPLEVGKTYTLSRYFKKDGNPLVIKVLRKERKKVDAGEFDCIVVQPIIQTSGMFSEGGEAEIWLSDDDRRLMVYMKSNIQGFPGALELYLKEYRPGVPLHPDSRVEAAEAREARAEADAAVGR